MLKISIIIPNNHQDNELLDLINAIFAQNYLPHEIIIIDSYGLNVNTISIISNICNFNKIEFLYYNSCNVMPGLARNIGLAKATSECIAFLDVKTLPRPHWLEEAINLLQTNNVMGVWGKCFFNADSFISRAIRDALFGIHPIKTLPGSIFKKELFTESGYFIPWVRAGEDTEWILRVKLLKINVI
jgi:cellulose synthase/poly-beta-1,6-N-acetylglucosamine synthase-like glycosyltransferase